MSRKGIRATRKLGGFGNNHNRSRVPILESIKVIKLIAINREENRDSQMETDMLRRYRPTSVVNIKMGVNASMVVKVEENNGETAADVPATAASFLE